MIYCTLDIIKCIVHKCKRICFSWIVSLLNFVLQEILPDLITTRDDIDMANIIHSENMYV